MSRLREAASASSLAVVGCTDAQSVGFVADGAGRCFEAGNKAVGACIVDSLDAFSLPALSGVGEAWQDGVPLLLLVLSTHATAHGTGPLTEFSKKLVLASSPESWESDFKAAAELACAAPAAPVSILLPRSPFLEALRGACADSPRGPSLLEASDASDTGALAAFQPTIPPALKAQPVPLTNPPPLPVEAGAEAAVSLLLSAKRPWIHVGMGCACEEVSGHKGLVQLLAESLEAPVSSTFSGKGVLREDHPLWLWPIAGPAMPNQLREVVESCDAVLILGAQMGEIASCRRQWPARRMKVVHVDADATVLGANFLPDVPVLGSVCAVLSLMLSDLQRRGIQPNMRQAEEGEEGGEGGFHDPTLRGELKAAHEALQAQMRAEALGLPEPGQCSPFGLYKALQDAMPPDSVFVADSGNGTVLSAEFLRLAGPRRFLAPTDFSSMGYCVPAAIGAALAARANGRQVMSVATVGDGSLLAIRSGLCRCLAVFGGVSGDVSGAGLSATGAFLMTGMEIRTALELKLPVICVILRDGDLTALVGKCPSWVFFALQTAELAALAAEESWA